MILVFTRGRSLTSFLIRAGTWSHWSHVALHDPYQDTAIGAVAGKGVIEQPLHEELAGSSAHEMVEVDCPDDLAGIAWARGQIGARYDWAGIAGFVGRQRDWQRPDAWFCSEFAEAALVAAGRNRWRRSAGRITPQHSWMAAS